MCTSYYPNVYQVCASTHIMANNSRITQVPYEREVWGMKNAANTVVIGSEMAEKTDFGMTV